MAAQQKCQAHLRRHCQRLVKTPGIDNELIGLALTEIVDIAFDQHRQWRESSNLEDYLNFSAQFKTRINLTLAEWSEKAGYEAGKLLRNLKLKADQWWYFLDHPEIPPDNNLAERALSEEVRGGFLRKNKSRLRLAVTKRKAAFG